MAFEIIAAQEQHIEELSQLFADAHNTTYVEFLPHFFAVVPASYWADRLRKAFQSPDYEIFIALDTEHQRCAGFCETFIRTTAVPYIQPNKRLILNNLYIHPRYRRRGLASLLLDRVIRFARQHHIPVIELEVASNNIVAQRLYQRFGFSPRTITMEYYLDQ